MPKLSALTPIDDLVKRLVVDNSACTLTSWDVERAADSLAETPPSEAELAAAREAMLENLVRLQVVASRAFALHRADERRDAEQKEQQRKAAIEAARRPWLEATTTPVGLATWWRAVFKELLRGARTIQNASGACTVSVSPAELKSGDTMTACCPSMHGILSFADCALFERFCEAWGIAKPFAVEAENGRIYALFSRCYGTPRLPEGAPVRFETKLPLYPAKVIVSPREAIAWSDEATGAPELHPDIGSVVRMFNLNEPAGQRMFIDALLAGRRAAV